MSLAIPFPDQREPTELHVFFGSGEAQKVTAQTINEIDTGTGTYRLVPPADYDRAWAFSTRNLFVKDPATGVEYHEVFTLEPISGVLQLLTSAPFPTSIQVNYYYYAAFATVKVKDLKKPDFDQSDTQDAYGHGVIPLQKKFPTHAEFRVYELDNDLIKSLLREGVRNNTFIMIIDDNINFNTYTSTASNLMRSGWAMEGPLFCDTIDLVDRGDDPAVLYKVKCFQFGNYYYHTSQDPVDQGWSGAPDFPDYWKGNPPTTLGVLTPPVPYAWPPDYWYDDPVFSNIEFCDLCTGNDDLSVSGPDYLAGKRIYNIAIPGGAGDPTSPNEFQWRFSEDGGATFSAFSSGISMAGSPTFFYLNDDNSNPAIPAFPYIRISFGAATGHDDSDFWTFYAIGYQPVALAILNFPPGGFITWSSNLPAPL